MTVIIETAATAAVPRTIVFQTANRIEIVALDHPLVIDGTPLAQVHVHRFTLGEVAEFQKQAGDDGDMRFIKFPMFRYADGGRVPDDVMDALDDDDAFRLTEVAVRFLPRRFRIAEETSASFQSNGEPTARS